MKISTVFSQNYTNTNVHKITPKRKLTNMASQYIRCLSLKESVSVAMGTQELDLLNAVIDSPLKVCVRFTHIVEVYSMFH